MMQFDLSKVESRLMVNYYCQADAIATLNVFKDVKVGTVNINVIELSKQAVREHKDIHKLIASKVFNVSYNEVTDEQRRAAKTLNFKELYHG